MEQRKICGCFAPAEIYETGERGFVWFAGGAAVPAAWSSARSAAGKSEAGGERKAATAEPGAQRLLRVREKETPSNQLEQSSKSHRLVRGRDGPKGPTQEQRDSK
ncbi:hypothetical protein C8R46DRAFT_1037679 [Mycena filopes]|nr:hypothetical protein C8R46DRAFT_1037679 [Mycena filopes]